MSNILSNIGLARRAGLIGFGFDDTVKEIKSEKKKIVGVLVTSDLSPKTLKELKFYANKFNVDVREIDVTMAEVESVLKKRTGIISIFDEGLFKLF